MNLLHIVLLFYITKIEQHQINKNKQHRIKQTKKKDKKRERKERKLFVVLFVHIAQFVSYLVGVFELLII